MRLTDVTGDHRRLLAELSRRISNRLEAHFSDLPSPDRDAIGIALRERGRKATLEVPDEVVIGAVDDAVTRESLRVRIKTRRDKMLFREPPAGIHGKVEPAHDPAFSRFGGPGRGGPPRGRR